MFSYVSGSELPGSSILDADDLSTSDPIATLLEGDLKNIRYLVELYPYNPEIAVDEQLHPAPFGVMAGSDIDTVTYGGIDTIYLSDHVFITEPTDEPANTPFAPMVENALTYDMSIWRGDTIGVNTASYGAIEITNYSGSLDDLVNKSLAGRRVVVKAGYEGKIIQPEDEYIYEDEDPVFEGSEQLLVEGGDSLNTYPYSNFAIVFDGLMTGVAHDDRGIILTISDNSLLLNKQIITPLYTGAGGLDGDTDLEGVMKPIALGKCYNIEPILVDAANLIYQCHAWSMEAVDKAFDAGVELTFDEDVADITTATPGAGQYSTSLATGHIKLGSTPAGRITADVLGDNEDGYVEQLGDVCQRIGLKLYDYLSFVPDDFSDGWNSLTDSVGVYIRDTITVRQLFDSLMNPCAAYWYFDRLGRLSARLIDTTGEINSSVTDELIDTAGMEMIQDIPPAWKITVAYAPVWTVQKEDELAGAASDAQRQFAANEYRYVVNENRALRNQYANPIERIFYTNLSEKTDAEALLSKFVDLYGQERRIYRGIVYEASYRNRIGDIVNLSYDRYGVGGEMLVIGIGEDARTGQTSLELFS